MNILVTGGTGFIGGHLVNKLKELGHKVVICDLGATSPDYAYDISDYNNLLRIKDDIDVIYHIAAQTSGYIGLVEPERDVDWNMKGTLNICRFAKERGVKKIIYTSSMAVYGEGDFFKETDEINPISHYGVSKLCGELYLKQYEQY